MKAVEIEQAISDLAEQPFDATHFPYAFLEAFGNKETTIKRLRSGNENKSDVEAGVLQRSNIHIAISRVGETNATLNKLRLSPATEKAKAKYILATDGEYFEAEDLTSGESVACPYVDFPNHFGFFLALAGISTIKQIRESSFDIRATIRLNRLYVELLKNNPEWSTAERRHDMNHFMARLIFCFFAEDTDIFRGKNLFTDTVNQMSAKDASDIDWVIGEVFRAMNTPTSERANGNFRSWADAFPYVNGGLFDGSVETPKFTKIARTYLLHVGSLDWTKINPDIFGSMIQAVADEEERGSLGMHYTSVPNILKVLNPLFLDNLRAELEVAADNPRKLFNLRKRMAHIRVFDPACGSGNFLVIAYKQMREIEAEINRRRGELHLKSEIPLTNFRGIELRDFSAEIARLALIIAEFQCDVVYIGQKEALQAFLPLDSHNWITCGNALRLDWLTIFPPTGTGVKLLSDDLFNTPLNQAEIDFENEGGETYICGNPPYVGSTIKAPKGASSELRQRLKKEAESRKSDLKAIFERRTVTWKSLDYVSGWFMKAADYGTKTNSTAAFVSTNSICQGQQVPTLWPLIFQTGHEINFAHTSFKWANLAAKNAGVTVVIVGISMSPIKKRQLFSIDKNDTLSVKEVDSINAYLVPAQNIIVDKISKPLCGLHEMGFGNKPVDGGHLLLSRSEVDLLDLSKDWKQKVVRRFHGAEDSINGKERYCFWLGEMDARQLSSYPIVSERLSQVREMRLDSDKKQTQELADVPYLFGEVRQTGIEQPVVIPRVSSEKREYLPFAVCGVGDIVGDSAFALYDAPLWNIALFASKLHLIWVATVCGKLKNDFRYSNTLGWNTFPVPKLTEKNKQDLSNCAEDILLAREAHFPATIAELYEVSDGLSKMPENLRRAHDRNDEVLERIYIGRRFKNDTERLEKMFELYMQISVQNKKGS